MYSRNSRLRLGVIVFVFLPLLFLQASLLNGQTKQVLAWRDNLAYIQSLPAAEVEAQRDALTQIRTGVEFWLRLHPDTKIQLQPAPPQPWNSEQTLSQVSLLRETVDKIIEEDPSRSFDLGVTEVSVTAETSPLSPITDSIDHTDMQELHLTNVAQAVQYLPGVTEDHKSNRNQAGVMIRGFDTRQVGLYLDNVPIYVPYDGYADITRFLTNDIAEVEVAKGYSSPLLGPNGLGGAVNLVTRQPEKKLEGDALMGTGSGRMIESGMHIGSRFGRFFFRGGMDWLQTDYYPISGDFKTNVYQPGYNRTNSDQRDVRYNGRFGWTPRGEDQYVFTYLNQKDGYNVPPYSGTDTVNNKVNFWQWPVWNRESYYLNTNTGLGESGSLKFRAFYDRYPNTQYQYTDATYSILSGVSPYNDYSSGGSAEFDSRLISHNALGGSFFFKDDTHQETSTSYSNGVPTYQPWRKDRDQQTSIGLQDIITITSRMRATVGFSADHLNSVKAQDVLTIKTGSGKNAKTTYSLAPFTCNGATITSFTDCLVHVWDYNPLASLSYSFVKSGTLYFTFAEKSHFPTLKDRYSYKNGQAIPNTQLQPEHARNWTLGYSYAFSFKTMMQFDLFRSDVYDAIESAIVQAQFSGQCPNYNPKLPLLCVQSINVGNEVHKGFEFTIRSTPISRLSVDANYSFLNRSITGASNMVSVYPTGSPRHKVVSTAIFQMPRNIQLLAAARYESGTVTSNNSGIVVPASRFGTLDLGGVIPIHSALKLQAGVKNLFDRNYWYQEGFPDPGRNWYCNLRYQF
jgi:iron complex outermembrane receptor protein